MTNYAISRIATFFAFFALFIAMIGFIGAFMSTNSFFYRMHGGGCYCRICLPILYH